jgi:hypothetical protein
MLCLFQRRAVTVIASKLHMTCLLSHATVAAIHIPCALQINVI